MNRFELDSILKKARWPEPPEAFWEEFPQQVARRFNRKRAENRPLRRSWFPRLAWGVATALCVLIAFAIGHWRGRVEMEVIPPKDVLADAKIVHETLAMFPNRVRAIIEDERGMSLVLSDNDNVPASEALYIRICNGKQCTSVVTFSGQEIQIAGQKVTVLSDAQGGIILEGTGFVWSSGGGNYAEKNLKIEARNLGEVL